VQIRPSGLAPEIQPGTSHVGPFHPSRPNINIVAFVALVSSVIVVEKFPWRVVNGDCSFHIGGIGVRYQPARGRWSDVRAAIKTSVASVRRVADPAMNAGSAAES